MAARKTVKVSEVKDLANKMLANSVDELTEGRQAVASMIEHVLMDTDNYKGFGYLPGVVDYTVSPPNVYGDETRRVYY